METAGEGKGKKEKKPLPNNRTILILPGVSRTHQGEGKKIVEFIVLGISPLIFLPAKGYIKVKNNHLLSNIVITLAGVFLTNLKIKRLFRSP